jgi:AraC family transcriptional activator of pobA
MQTKHINQPLIFQSIAQLHRAFDLSKPLHPFVSLLDYSKVNFDLNIVEKAFVSNFYNITYNGVSGCSIKYGQNICDFDDGGMFFTSPNQIIKGLVMANSSLGFTLLIHPDFLRNYALDSKIKNYGFFSYAVKESLHLSDKEKTIIAAIFKNIGEELETSIDDFSQDVLISQIELLLNYSQRFYKRQFITRKLINNDLLGKLDSLLNSYFNKESSLINGLPTVQYLSEKLSVTPRYLSVVRHFSADENENR